MFAVGETIKLVIYSLPSLLILTVLIPELAGIDIFLIAPLWLIDNPNTGQ